jgi:preprotein translocase subunit SecB
MKTQSEAPTSGFHLLRVVAIHQEHSTVLDEPPSESTRRIKVEWDWITREDRQFDVFLGVDVQASKDAPESVNIEIVGEFAMRSDVPSLSFQSFVQTAAPAILFPYAREIISSLTGRGPFGAYYLPSINVVRLMKDYDFDSTSGAQQLRDDPRLSAIFGWPADTQLQLLEKDKE